jgi:ABC-type nitrate/sulfonate/bicarbonate transport system permease component
MLPHLKRRAYITAAMLSPILLLGLWTFVTHQKGVPSIILPPPEAVVASLLDMM